MNKPMHQKPLIQTTLDVVASLGETISQYSSALKTKAPRQRQKRARENENEKMVIILVVGERHDERRTDCSIELPCFGFHLR